MEFRIAPKGTLKISLAFISEHEQTYIEPLLKFLTAPTQAERNVVYNFKFQLDGRRSIYYNPGAGLSDLGITLKAGCEIITCCVREKNCEVLQEL